MLNLNNATRLYTDVEILEKFAKYVYANGIEDDTLKKYFGVDAVALVSEIVEYDPDFIRGFVSRVIRDLQKA